MSFYSFFISKTAGMSQKEKLLSKKNNRHDGDRFIFLQHLYLCG